MTTWILSTAALIAVLAVLRRVLRGRIDPRFQYALWLLAALRILTPGALFPAPVSVAGLAEQTGVTQAVDAVRYDTRRDTLYSAPGQGQTPEDFLDYVQHSDLLQETYGSASVTVVAAEPTEESAAGAGAVRLEVEVTRDRTALIRTVWLVGMAGLALWFLLVNLRFSLRLRRSRRLYEGPLPIPCPLPVYVMEDLPSPCLSGLLRPAIYLNESQVVEGRLTHILTHELTHYRHRDHWWAVLRCLCLAVQWFNPLVWLAAHLSRRDCETACDAAVLRRLGPEQRLSYGRTLVDMVAVQRSPAALFQTATTMTGGKRSIAERVALIVKQPKMSILTLLCALLLALLAAGCAFGGTAAESDPPEDLPSDMDTAALASQLFRDIVGAAESRNFYVTVDDGTATRLHIYPGNDFNVDGCQYTMDAHPWAATFSSQTPAGASLTLESADGSSLLRCWADSDLVLFQQDGRDSWATCSPVEGNLYDHLLCIPNDAVLQGVWNTPVSGALTDYQAVLRQFAQQAAAGLRDLPAWCLYRPLDAQPADVYVEDYYFGPGENFCGGFGLYLMLDNGESSPWQAGSGMEQVAEGPYAGYWSWRICASFARDEAGDWVCTGRYTGRAALIYPTPLDEATVAELLDDYFHTGGVAHDYRIPLELRRRTPEQLADLNALLDGYSSQEVQDFCTQMGFHLGEYPDYADLGYDEFAALLTGDWLAALTAGYQSATSLT